MMDAPIRLTEEEVLKTHLPEHIGQVSLNYDYYSGEDLYSDGDIEDRLLDIVTKSVRAEFPTIIEDAMSWPILYHLSPVRGNIVDFLPINRESKVLEIGSGCGAITETLSRKAGKVTCVDLSARRSRINATRNSDRDNIEIYVGNFNDIEPHLDTDYDYVCLIGVFEYGSSYIPTDTPYEDFLKIILKHAKKATGRVVIAIENKFGLKYWAGCAEDHNGEFYSSIEGYPNGGSARTFTRNGLENIFNACGVKKYHFYYPYPDYKLPHTIYSDKRLPHKGELTDNLRNFDRNRLMTINEAYAFDSIIEDGEFPLFSNSYMAILGPDIDVSYSKFSNDRKPQYAIRTDIEADCVKKIPLSKEAYAHLKNMAENYDLLTKRYEGSGIRINKCLFDEETGVATFDFEKGRALEELLDEALYDDNREQFDTLFHKFVQLTSYNASFPVTDLDLIFANILVDGEDWVLIDYEWCVKEARDPKEGAFRALYCYSLEDERRNALNKAKLMDDIGVNPDLAAFYREKEADFQKEVTGRHKSLGEIRATIGTHAVDAKKLLNKYLKKVLDERIQLYFNYGQGYSEANSKYLPDVYLEPNHIVADIELDGNLKSIRIDPADYTCIVRMNELDINGNNLLDNKKVFTTNGKCMKTRAFVFNTEDPNMEIQLNDVLTPGKNLLHVDFELERISEKMAEEIWNSIKKLF